MHEISEYKSMDYLSLVNEITRQKRKFAVISDFYDGLLAEQRITEDDNKGQYYRQAITNVETKIDALRAEERRRRNNEVAW